MEISNNMLAMRAIVMAMGLVGGLAIDMMTDFQNAQAKRSEGLPKKWNRVQCQ